MSDQEHEMDSDATEEEGETKDTAEEEPQPDVLSDYRTGGGAPE